MRTMHAEACILQAEYLRCLSVRLRRLLILVVLVVLVDVDCRTVLWEVLVALECCWMLFLNLSKFLKTVLNVKLHAAESSQFW